MTIRHFNYIIASIILIILVIKFYPSDQIIHPYGIMIEEYPIVSEISATDSWELEGYKLTTLKQIKIKAIVLSKEKYTRDRESDLSPYDLALGWGLMSDQRNLEKINISQSSRWFFWESKEMPLSVSEIESHCSNIHIIPSSEKINGNFDDIKIGEIISLEGYLIRVDAQDGWKWISSTSWNDTGSGACEIIWVEKLMIHE